MATRSGADLKLMEAILESMPQLYIQMIVLLAGFISHTEWIAYVSVVTSSLSASVAVTHKMLHLLGEPKPMTPWPWWQVRLPGRSCNRDKTCANPLAQKKKKKKKR